MDGYKKIIKNKNTRFKILHLLRFIPDKQMLMLEYKIKFGRKLNLKNPKRFTEKMQKYKLCYRNPLMVECSDKDTVRNYVKNKGLEHILNDIEIAKNNHAYISALSLSLTLPNILSNIEYGKVTFKNEYIQWFDDWVYKYYEHPKSENELINRGIEATKFDGNACYLLRCALLHSGNTDLKDSKGCRKIDWFELCISDISPHCGDAYVCDVSSEKAHNV